MTTGLALSPKKKPFNLSPRRAHYHQQLPVRIYRLGACQLTLRHRASPNSSLDLIRCLKTGATWLPSLAHEAFVIWLIKQTIKS